MNSTGKKFEQLFQDSCKLQEISASRLKDVGFQGNSQQGMRFSSSNICDFICYHGGKYEWFLELKSGKDRITFDRLKQTDRLNKKQDSSIHVRTAYLFEICKGDDKNYFLLSSKLVAEFQEFTSKKSFNLDDLVNFEYARKIPTYIPDRKRKARLNLNFIGE